MKVKHKNIYQNSHYKRTVIDNYTLCYKTFFTLAFPLFLAAGNMLTAPLRFREAGNDGADFWGDSGFSFGLAVAVTVIPLVARMLATALASDFLGSSTFGGGLRTLKVIESDRCIMLLSAGSEVPPY